jgi:hypothetical protein
MRSDFAHPPQCRSVPADWFSGKRKEVRPWCIAWPFSPVLSVQYWTLFTGSLSNSCLSASFPARLAVTRDKQSGPKQF